MKREDIVTIVESVLVKHRLIAPPKPERRPVSDDGHVHRWLAGLAGVNTIDNSRVIQNELDARHMYLAPEHLQPADVARFAERLVAVGNNDAFRGWDAVFQPSK